MARCTTGPMTYGCARAQPEVEWEKTFGGDEGDRAYSVQQTSDGGYIIAGETGSYGEGFYDVYLIKLRPEFQYHFQTKPYSNVVHMDVDANGWINGYMTGGYTDWNPVLGKLEGDRVCMAVDFVPDGNTVYQTLFLIGKVSTLTGQFTVTKDGVSYLGPLDVKLVFVDERDRMDDDGVSPEPAEIAVAVIVQGDEVIVDFHGTSPQRRGGINAVYAITLSA